MNITLKGKNEGSEVVFDPSLHIELSDGFYEREDSENVTVVNGRYYRKNSPLICKLSEKFYGEDQYARKSDVITDCFSGEIIHKSESSPLRSKSLPVRFVGNSSESFEVLKNTGYYYYKNQLEPVVLFYEDAYREFVVESSNISQIRNEFIIEQNYGYFVQKSKCFELHQSYGESRFIPDGVAVRGGMTYNSLNDHIRAKRVVEINGSLYWKIDIIYTVDLSGDEYKPIKNMRTGEVIDKRTSPTVSILSLSKNVYVTIEKAISSGSTAMLNQILKRQMFTSSMLDADFSPDKSYDTPLGISVSIERDARILEKMHAMMVSENAKVRASSLMSGAGYLSSIEPFPELYTGTSIGNQGGDYVYFNGGKINKIGKSFDSTGGVNYTFGVEIETDRGVTPYEVVKTLGVDAVGDRSIGSLEYVTGVLAGDEGMSHLDKIVDTVSDYAIVSDTCGIHVHIGGHKDAGMPIFNKKFSVLSVMLGCQIEKELFSLLPPNRRERTNSNGQSYCASILDYSDMNLKSWEKSLFQYVMGRFPEDESESFKSLTEGINPRHSVNRWASSRYKWLNLVNCLTDNSGRRNGGGFQTIEFRAFNGTLNKRDVKAFVLISLAFVKYVETMQDAITKKSNTLTDVASVLNKDGFNFLTSWMAERKSLLSELSKKPVL